MASLLRQMEKSFRCLRLQTLPIHPVQPKSRQLSTTPRKKTRKALQSRSGVLAVKKGMSAVWDSAGKRNAVTVLQIPQAQVIAHKLMEKNGYWANQIGIGYRAPRNLSKAMLGHFAVAQVPPKAKVAEFRVKDETGLLPLGTEILASHFTEGQYVDVKGTGKGKGFAGVMKRWGFHGLPASHGVSIKHRSGGSTGQSQDPGRVLPGKKMAGHMGAKSVTTLNLLVLKVDTELGVLMVKGAVPGPAKGYVYVRDALRLKNSKRVASGTPT